ncbi:MAG: anti-sigma factor antagonist [Streptosporangiaceae bacterium]
MRAPIHQRIPVAAAYPRTMLRRDAAQCEVTATVSLLSAKLRDAGHELIPASAAAGDDPAASSPVIPLAASFAPAGPAQPAAPAPPAVVIAPAAAVAPAVVIAPALPLAPSGPALPLGPAELPGPSVLPAAIRVIAGLPRRDAPRVAGLLIHDRDEVAVLSLRGEPDFIGASVLQTQLSHLRWQARARSVVDLTHLAFLDCASLGVLVRHRRLICGQGGSFALAGPQPAVLTILAVTGLRTWFEVYDTVEQAVADAGPRLSPVFLAALAQTSSRP